MILSSLNDTTRYDLAASRFSAAYTWLKTTDLESLAPGSYPIEGDKVFANVQEIKTVPTAEKDFEAHRHYADIHCVISGTEVIEVAPIENCKPVNDFDDDNDFGLYTTAAVKAVLTLGPGDLAVTPPSDAHKPGCCDASGPAPLKKVCVKVFLA